MKLWSSAAASLLLAATLPAFEIPRSVHRIADFSKASAEAAERKKPLLFVYTDPALKPT